MTLSRADFILIAEVVAEATEGGPTSRNWLAIKFANRLAATNPKFNRSRFLKACGVEG